MKFNTAIRSRFQSQLGTIQTELEPRAHTHNVVHFNPNLVRFKHDLDEAAEGKSAIFQSQLGTIQTVHSHTARCPFFSFQSQLGTIQTVIKDILLMGFDEFQSQLGTIQTDRFLDEFD